MSFLPYLQFLLVYYHPDTVDARGIDSLVDRKSDGLAVDNKVPGNSQV